jgi:hypothetical protein
MNCEGGKLKQQKSSQEFFNKQVLRERRGTIARVGDKCATAAERFHFSAFISSGLVKHMLP